MRAAARILALVLAAASPAGAQKVPLQDTDTLDPTPPGTLHPEPLPPLINPDAPSTPAMELFARKAHAVSRPRALNRFLLRRLPWRCSAAADHGPLLASDAAVAQSQLG